MALVFKKIVSLARKRTHNPQKETRLLQKLLPKFSVVIPEEGGGVEKLADIFRPFPAPSLMRMKSEILGYHEDKAPEIPGRAASRLARDDAKNQPIKQYASYGLEIGFGSGENVLSLAKNNPDIGWIACEVFTGGVAKLLEDMQALELGNIRIWHDDALELIPRLPLNSLSLIYILHPDPWPKRKHHNRRLVNAENLKLLASKMIKGAKLLIITDHQDYAQHITRVIPEVADLFDLEFDNYPEIVKTKYRLKADAKNIESKYFCLIRK